MTKALVNKSRSHSENVNGNSPSDDEDRYVREDECRRLSGLSRVTRWRLEQKGKFPRRRQLSENAVGWLLSEVLKWCNSRPTAPEGR